MARPHFRLRDGLRAIKVARDGGIEPAMVEVTVAKDGGATFRVYGEKAGAPEHGAKAWDEATAKLQAAAKAKGA